MELHKPLPQSFTNMYILVRDMMKQQNIVLKFQTEEFYVALANIEDLVHGHCLTSKQGGYKFVSKHSKKNTNRTTGEFLVQLLTYISRRWSQKLSS